ncbi:MAG: TonB-dependent receptor [Bryobacteraceae bacterium]|nr:TonB-dependent receptor [Bryobacteraceae bacterium]
MNSIALAVLILSQADKPEAKPELPVIRTQVTVVSGSRVAELQDESPMRVEAVTAEDMKRTGYERLSDVLAEIPGVVTRSGSSGSVGAEQIQGIDSRQVLVLQDGLPVVGARGIKRGQLNLNRQSVGRLGQVEVAKGAGSPIYGTDAIGGVINMITREPQTRFDSGLTLSGGTLGSFDGRYDIGTRLKKLTLFGDVEHHRADSYRLIPNSTTTVGPQWHRNDALFKSRYQFTDRFALGFTANAYWNREDGRNLSETGLVDGVGRDRMATYALVGDFTLSARTTLQTRGYTARYRETATTVPIGGGATDFANLDEDLNRLDATLSHQFGNSHLVQAGGEWSQNLYRGLNRLVGDNAGQQVTYSDVWLQDRFQFRRLTITAGGRFHRHSLFGNWAVPRAGVVYRLSDKWIARASFGKGFRAPDLGQLYFRFANPASFYQVIGNPNLGPERSTSWSTGVSYRSRRFRGGVSLFRNDVSNLIDSYVAGFPRTSQQLADLMAQFGIPLTFNPLLGRQTIVYRNLASVYTRGVEIDGEAGIGWGFRARGAYTFLDAEDKSTGLDLAQRHRHQGFAGIDYINPRAGVIANVRTTFFSRFPLVPASGTFGYGYRLIDFYVSKDLPRGIQMFLAVDNLNDSRDRKLALATPTFDRADYGRMFRVGARYTFRKTD